MFALKSHQYPYSCHMSSRSLTPSVLDEALSLKPDPPSLIISYHPPIFKPLSSLTLSNPLQSSLLTCAANGISVYSPHTALDSTFNGINEWLAEGISQQEEGMPGGMLCSLAGEEMDFNTPDWDLGRQVRFGTPVDMKVLESRIMNHLNLTQSCRQLLSIRFFFG
jgi:putative NIF3 family GTP cyclohydrolase 1 type 2